MIADGYRSCGYVASVTISSRSLADGLLTEKVGDELKAIYGRPNRTDGFGAATWSIPEQTCGPGFKRLSSEKRLPAFAGNVSEDT